jgi:p-hydroxybenzoate 3-monooxygenase
MKTQIAIVGGGPAGSLLSHLLDRAGVDNVVLERRSRDYVLGRIRAGVIEHGTVQLLRDAGLGECMDQQGDVHDGVELAFGGRRLRVDFKRLTDKYVMVYGQTQIQDDLYAAAADRDANFVFEAQDVAVHAVTTDSPYLTYTVDASHQRLECDWVAGCDGSHGVTPTVIPDDQRQVFTRDYPFGWLGILSETPPVNDELIYANHERGFALCSMRHSMLSRYYVQCDLEDNIGDWSDDRFWSELTARLPDDVTDHLVTGPSIEKSITPLRSMVVEPMRWGRLLLAGDAAHIVPPTGAKGLNLALGDVTYLFRAFEQFYADGSTTGLDDYSETALLRVWKSVRFSWWMTTLLHRFPDRDDGFDRRIQQTELEYLADSEAYRRILAENYVGLPL